MKTKSNFKIVLGVFLTLFLFSTSRADNLYGGIEIGSKGVKMSLVSVKDSKKGIYEIIDFWTENVGIAKGIAIDGKLAVTDIETAIKIVLKNYKKFTNEIYLKKDKIFIVASSGVGMATNASILVDKIKELTDLDLNIIASNLEAKLLYKGSVPPASYKNSMILDIGGGNTKGGFVEIVNENMVFFPLNMDLGTITLTEKINKTATQENANDFFNQSKNYLPKLAMQVDQMYEERPDSKEKPNVYMSGGAVWAFYVLYKGNAEENFCKFSLDEVKLYNEKIRNNFSEFEQMALTNKDVAKVLSTYSKNYLISGNNLLIASLENLTNLDTKKLYFVKNGQISWLMAYITESSKGVKPVY